MSFTLSPSCPLLGCSNPLRPFRYDFFVIWGNGLQHTESILQHLRSEPHLQIMRLESRKVRNIRKFVYGLYACDSVPISHLRAKLKYLFLERQEIFIVFVKNLAPHENYAGERHFRHIQCSYIQKVKQGIRDLYNPRRDGKRTENHVIHASDYEEQVDYFLRLLGYHEGLSFLDDTEASLPFEKPYYLEKPRTYTFKNIPIEQLRASILTGSAKVNTELVAVEETPHFQSLHGDPQPYRDYLLRYKYTYLHEDYSVERFLGLSAMSPKQFAKIGPAIVRATGPYYQILDGLHRTSVALYHGCESVRCVEVA